MRPRRHFITAVIIILGIAIHVCAQRKITPVIPKTGPGSEPVKEQPVDPKAGLAEMKDSQGNVVFVDTITGQEWVDTTVVAKKTAMIYPLMESVTVGVNLWDPAMRIFGQHYGGVDFWAELSLHNRYKPVFEAGFGSCDDTPDGKNYTFKTKMAPFFRIGINYNIFYNNSPKYQLVAGIRYGFTPFSYEVTNVTMPPGYWDEDAKFDIPSQSTTAGFFEFVAGVRVGIIKNISLGWTVKYHTLLHEGKAKYGKPMYIPGFGKRGSSFTGSFSISYTLPLNKPEVSAVTTDTDTK